MKVSEFDFELPVERIALRPVRPRDSARLLVIRPDDHLRDHHIVDLGHLLSSGDRLVFNDTRVIPARLHGRRGRAKVEITLYQKKVRPVSLKPASKSNRYCLHYWRYFFFKLPIWRYLHLFLVWESTLVMPWIFLVPQLERPI